MNLAALLIPALRWDPTHGFAYLHDTIDDALELGVGGFLIRGGRRDAITALTKALGLGCWVVTWDGVYGESEWRIPENIFRRGDQSNSLLFDRHFDLYEATDSEGKLLHASMADGSVGSPP